MSGLKPHIREEVIRQSPKTLDDAFDLAVQSEKINYAPTKTGGATALPVMPVDQHNMPPPAEDTEADLLAALEDAEAENENWVAAIKLKLNKFRRNGQSSGNRSSAGKNSNKALSGTKKPNPDKDVKCRYCNKMGHYQPENATGLPLSPTTAPRTLRAPTPPWTCPEWLRLLHLCSMPPPGPPSRLGAGRIPSPLSYGVLPKSGPGFSVTSVIKPVHSHCATKTHNTLHLDLYNRRTNKFFNQLTFCQTLLAICSLTISQVNSAFKSDRPFVTIKAQGVTSSWLYDTGAAIALISITEFRKILPENWPPKKPVMVNLTCASDQQLKTIAL